jgi:preprotein translocase subunit YajC
MDLRDQVAGHPRDYNPAENVVNIITVGPMVKEALKASDQLLKQGIFANVIVVTSSTLLHGNLGHKDDYQQLRKLIPVNETVFTPTVGVADADPDYLAQIGDILGLNLGMPILGLRKNGVSTRGTARIYVHQGISFQNIAETAWSELDRRDGDMDGKVSATMDALEISKGDQALLAKQKEKVAQVMVDLVNNSGFTLSKIPDDGWHISGEGFRSYREDGTLEHASMEGEVSIDFWPTTKSWRIEVVSEYDEGETRGQKPNRIYTSRIEWINQKLKISLGPTGGMDNQYEVIGELAVAENPFSSLKFGPKTPGEKYSLNQTEILLDPKVFAQLEEQIDEVNQLTYATWKISPGRDKAMLANFKKGDRVKYKLNGVGGEVQVANPQFIIVKFDRNVPFFNEPGTKADIVKFMTNEIPTYIDRAALGDSLKDLPAKFPTRANLSPAKMDILIAAINEVAAGHGFPPTDLERLRLARLETNGGFEEGYVLIDDQRLVRTKGPSIVKEQKKYHVVQGSVLITALMAKLEEERRESLEAILKVGEDGMGDFKIHMSNLLEAAVTLRKMADQATLADYVPLALSAAIYKAPKSDVLDWVSENSGKVTLLGLGVTVFILYCLGVKSEKQEQERKAKEEEELQRGYDVQTIEVNYQYNTQMGAEQEVLEHELATYFADGWELHDTVSHSAQSGDMSGSGNWVDMVSATVRIKRLKNYKPEDKALLSNKQDLTPGGIDMNKIDINKTGQEIQVEFDEKQLQNLMNGNFGGFAPVIINFIPINSVFPILGLQPRTKEEELQISSAK